MRSIERCCRFGATELREPATLPVRRKLPPLARTQVERLPEGLRAEHQVWVERPAGGAPIALEHMRQRARQMALSLLELGEDGAATERQLARWRIHPAVAHEATGWAVARHREQQRAQVQQLRCSRAARRRARSTRPDRGRLSRRCACGTGGTRPAPR